MVILRNLTGRVSVCISSQVGCAVGCAFCATGQGGICRNLSAEEIADQVLLARVLLKEEERSQKHEAGSTKETMPSNVIVMGMGEPFHNYDAIVEALDLINRKLNIGGRRLTVSTVGIVPGIRKFASEDLQVNLAVSLHSVDPAVRSQLIPINAVYPLPELKAAIEHYIALTRRKVFFEYIMLSGVNDSFADAQALAAWLPRDLSHVNLIRYNQVAGSAFAPSPPEVIAGFQKILQDRGIPTTLRHPMGDDIQAACGQLAGRKRLTG
jgi:23S rRNA (adenine2503-C2)-methyltransferase